MMQMQGSNTRVERGWQTARQEAEEAGVDCLGKLRSRRPGGTWRPGGAGWRRQRQWEQGTEGGSDKGKQRGRGGNVCLPVATRPCS